MHCAQGVSRSVTVIAAYLMKYKGLRLLPALLHIKLARRGALPTLTFLLTLRELEVALHGSPSLKEDDLVYHRSFGLAVAALAAKKAKKAGGSKLRGGGGGGGSKGTPPLPESAPPTTATSKESASGQVAFIGGAERKWPLNPPGRCEDRL